MLVNEHRGAFEYDWRARFHLGWAEVGRSMTWAEALRLTDILRRDPSSQVAASISDWQYPLSREALTLRDIFDLEHQSMTKRRPKPYPRPWDPAPKRIGGASVSVAEFEAIKASVRASAGQPRDARGRFVKVT